MARFRRLARDYKRLSASLEGSSIVALLPCRVDRIVRALCLEGLAVRLDGGKTFALGPLAFELRISAIRFPFKEAATASMERIAAETGDTCFLILKLGDDAICVDRREGSYPVKALTIEVGHRRPLGAAAASLALLMHLSPEELDAYFTADVDRIERYGLLTADIVRALDVQARTLGFALNNNIIPEVSAVGVAIPSCATVPYAALSVAALSSRITRQDRHLAIVALLKREAEAISVALTASTMRQVHHWCASLCLSYRGPTHLGVAYEDL